MRRARTLWSIGVVALALSGAWASPSAAAGTSVRAPDRLGPLAGPQRHSTAGTLYDVSASSSRDAWAVGTFRGDSRGPLAAHWDGQSWSVIDTPLIDAGLLEFHGVTAVSADDVWAVGLYGDLPDYHPLVEHWDGSTWTQVEAPDYDGQSTSLSGVSAVASDDVWAIGNADDGQAVTEHWDGASWTVTALPTTSGLDVSAVSHTNVWTASAQTLAHWNGRHWRATEGGPSYASISASAADDVWAVGRLLDGSVAALHWDGSTWTPTIVPGAVPQALFAVDGLAPDDAWAVGQRQVDGRNRAFAVHWDGAAWSVVGTPRTTGSRLLGVQLRASNDGWAVGSMSGHFANILHWNGSRWSRYALANSTG